MVGAHLVPFAAASAALAAQGPWALSTPSATTSLSLASPPHAAHQAHHLNPPPLNGHGHDDDDGDVGFSYAHAQAAARQHQQQQLHLHQAQQQRAMHAHYLQQHHHQHQQQHAHQGSLRVPTSTNAAADADRLLANWWHRRASRGLASALHQADHHDWALAEGLAALDLTHQHGHGNGSSDNLAAHRAATPPPPPHQPAPFSLVEDASFCPLPYATLAKDHGCSEDDLHHALVAHLHPHWAAAAAAAKYRTPSPTDTPSSTSSRRSRAWSSTSSLASDEFSPATPVAAPPAVVATSVSAVPRTNTAVVPSPVKIMDPWTGQEVDLRAAAAARAHLRK
ncbi:hypothetical protein AMAG_13976 [Allomyces macrogynus ATCC 38327]|uniref:Uncharacterized protein n=1 Tax=Allomyces macrogynus (strain ATCC 38327) TaxID=578462 RepID=A0A0L0T2N8_ALLM3|nr:hypothetical protein AMAG_13976 [Allomyces macrogynus ATCC 38327]|eukprot:KNE69118.1 hypothetical protein AMAG_13976 [Allomyces macrogynus ATCC 38327]